MIMANGSKTLFWLGRKVLIAILPAAVALGAAAGWLHWQDEPHAEQSRQTAIREFIAESNRLTAELANLRGQIDDWRIQRRALLERTRQAATVAEQLEEATSGINRLTSDSAQLREDRERLRRMRERATLASRRADELEQTLTRLQWRKDGVEIAVARVARQLQAAQSPGSRAAYYLLAAWQRYGIHFLVIILLILALEYLLSSRRKAAG